MIAYLSGLVRLPFSGQLVPGQKYFCLQGDLEAGMVVIDGQHGLPALPAAQFQLVWRAAGSTAAAEAFGQLLREWSAAAAA